MVVAVDFDGTIVEHEYPRIGKEKPFATATLKRLLREKPDLKLILWTVRQGKLLDEAVEWCRERGVEFYAVNANYLDETVPKGTTGCRKLTADVYIDDRNIGGFPGWGNIYAMLGGKPDEPQPSLSKPQKKTFLQKLFGGE